jgi:hypothetical protein
MGLQQFERRLERLVEGAFAKAFRSSLRPVELGRRLTREMDLHRTVGVRGGLIAPNHFSVALAPSDREQFATFEDALVRDLGEMAREHAREEAYSFLGPVSVELITDDGLGAGQFLLASEVSEAPGGGPTGSLVQADGSRIVLGDDPVTIGRLPECDVVLSDPNVSRRHAEVRRQGDDIVVVDLDSTNGTKVNGAGVKERKLRDGDEISVGTARLRFEAS